MDINTEHSGIAILLLLIALPIAGFLYGFRKGRRTMSRDSLMQPPPLAAAPPPHPEQPAPRALSSEAEARVREALARDRKIEAIKILRDETGLRLAEAKDAVEALERERER